jgi:hypothetical protein
VSADRLLRLELARLNSHLPETKISLKQALGFKKPSVKTRDGSIHRFDQEELKLLARMIPEENREELKLPILIHFNPKLGAGAARIVGRREVEVICKLLEKEGKGEELVIYRPEVAAVRRRLPTTTQYCFLG